MNALRFIRPFCGCRCLAAFVLLSACWLAGAAAADEPDTSWEPEKLTAREHPYTAAASYLASPTGRSVLVTTKTRDGKREMELMNPITGKEIGAIRPTEQHAVGLHFSWDGGTLLLGAFRASVEGWDTREGKALGKPIPLSEKISPTYGVSPVPNSVEMLRLEAGGSKVVRWDLAKGEKVGETVQLPEPANLVICRPDGKSFLTYDGVKGRKIRLWDIKSGKQIAKPFSVPPRVGVIKGTAGIRVMEMTCLSPDGKLFLLGPQGQYDKIKEWQVLDLEAGKILWKFDPNLCAFSGDGKRLARLVGGTFHFGEHTATSVSVHESRTGKLVKSIKLTGPEKGVTAYGTAVALSPEGRYLAVGCFLKGPRPKDPSKRREGMLQVFDLTTGKPASEKQFYQHAPTSIRFTPDGKAFTAVTWPRNQANDKVGKLEIQLFHRKGTDSPGDKDQSSKDKNGKDKQ